MSVSRGVSNAWRLVRQCLVYQKGNPGFFSALEGDPPSAGPSEHLGDPCLRHHPSSSPAIPSGDGCKADRVAVLNDAAEYFALRAALLLAERQVEIVGWDIHSETCLVGPSGAADDGFPVTLGPFLKALLAARAGLRINILSWN